MNIRASRCRRCDQYIVFLETPRGAQMPVDIESVEEGDDAYDDSKHVSHFTTCTNPEEFSRNRKR